MSELRKGDTIYYKGDKGRIINVMADGEGELLEIALTTTKLTYLEQHQLDLYPFPETLNENQQIVLEWLKKEYAERNLFPTEVAWLLFESVDNGYFEPEEERAFENLNKLQEAQVLQAFASWVEQEEE